MSRDETVVTRWFGPAFDELHPLLQALHRSGGVLRGEIDIRVGRGIAGWLGRRLAKSVGIPVDQLRRGFEVTIRHRSDALEWNRRFDNGAVMRSLFRPIGQRPQGHWVENTGPIEMHMTVDVEQGGWTWRLLRAYLRGVRVPLFLLPRSRAGKRIENGRYVFEVAFVLPLLGTVLSYGGALDAQAA